MGAEGDNGANRGTNQGGKLAAGAAVATILSGFGGFYLVAKTEILEACTAFDASWCKRSEASAAGAERGIVDPPAAPLPLASGIAIAVEPSLPTDAMPAAALMQGLKGALGSVGDAASGYQIEGAVSGFANPVPRRSQFTFSWTIRRGSVAVRCKDVPVSYPSNMSGAAAQIVSTAIAPAIAESVKYRDVRCS